MNWAGTGVALCARCSEDGMAVPGTLDDGGNWFCDDHLDGSGDPPDWGDCDLCDTVTWRYRLPVSSGDGSSDVLRACDDCRPEWSK